VDNGRTGCLYFNNQIKGGKTIYAPLSTFNIGPGKRAVGEKLADQSAQLLKNLKGFKEVIYFADVEAGEYASLTIWESKEDVEAANLIIGPKTQEAVGSLMKAPPTRKIFEVYKPKS
jgi:heme-degrading monooxygenase HmoA